MVQGRTGGHHDFERRLCLGVWGIHVAPAAEEQPEQLRISRSNRGMNRRAEERMDANRLIQWR